MTSRKATGIVVLSIVVIWIIFHATSLFFYLNELRDIVRRRIDHLSWSAPTTIYSAPFLLYQGQDIQEAELFTRLQRLGYRTVSTAKPRPGEMKIIANTVHVYTKPALLAEGPRVSEHVFLTLEANRRIKEISVETAAGLEPRQSYDLEPEILSYLFSDTVEKRQVVKLDEVPALLLKTLILIEDARFLTHVGIDVKGILRALYHDLRSGNLVQGGSTLTQQLSKNFFLNRQRKISRKINEALMSLIIEREYSKDQILEAYINEIYFGQDGSYPIHGIKEASLYYFSKPPTDLNLAEIALLVGIVRGPNVYSPSTQPENAKKRRSTVLSKLLEEEFISQSEHDQAMEEPLPAPPRSRYQHRSAPYFVDFVVMELVRLFDQRSLSGQGFHVFTTLDPILQTRAQRAFIDYNKKTPDTLESAFVLLDHHSGDVLALSGGHDYGASQFNRAVQAKRQPGSLFKPVVFLQALIDTFLGSKTFYNWTSLSDTLFTWKYDQQTWAPKNYDNKFHGDVTVGEALSRSYNASTARLAHEVGLEPIIQLAIALGFEGPIPLVPSIILGSIEATPLEVATVFGSIANQCFQFRPSPIRAVYDANQELVQSREDNPKQVAPAPACWMLSQWMKETLQTGTATSVSKRSWSSEYAGKTGTTSNENDAWFAGFDSRWTLVVWLGSDLPESTRLTGASGALPLWASIIDQIHTLRPLPTPAPAPDSVQIGRIAPPFGNCRNPIEVRYFEANPPPELCK